MSDRFRFELLATDSQTGLRAGVLHTPHGPLPTPGFMPVGTAATVKALTPADLRKTGARCVLGNTYHLTLRPGPSTVRALGGLHGMMRWDGPILTDSGGFQVFSLGAIREVDDDGVSFQSHLDGTPLRFTPESVIATEEALGADLIMPLDECLGPRASRMATEVALERTQRWYARSLEAKTRDDQALFALVQGGLFSDLRVKAAEAAGRTDAPGFAIGGFSIGEPREVTAPLLADTVSALPGDRPRYLMGVGSPQELADYSRLGVDLFDCVLPTRLARNGALWIDPVSGARLDLGKRSLLNAEGPIAPSCTCATCTGWPLGTLASLFQSGDPLAYRLGSIHNVAILTNLLGGIREALLAGNPRNAGVAATVYTAS